MLIINGNKNNDHKTIILSELQNADEILLAVSYIRSSGVKILINSMRDKTIKILCTLEMGITQLDALKLLLTNGVDVKIYKTKGKGSYHPKVWLFKNRKMASVIIGSANLSASALSYNIESSILIKNGNPIDNDIIKEAIKNFNYLWDQTNSYIIKLDEIEILKNELNNRAELNKKISMRNNKPETLIFDFLKNWITLDKQIQATNIKSSLWRGWYIIPDQGYINDKLIGELKGYVDFIFKNNGLINLNEDDENYKKFLELFTKNRQFKRKELKETRHQLFVRQAKNYLIKFGWVDYPMKPNGNSNKSVLTLTYQGESVANCKEIDCIKNIYSEFFWDYEFNGLYIVRFTKQLVELFDSIDLNEFSMFVMHAYNENDFTLVSNLIKLYRDLAKEQRDSLIENYKKFFNKIKEPDDKGNKNVYGNYYKNAKHNMSAIGWSRYFDFDENYFIIKNKV